MDGQKLKNLREKHNLTQKDLAEAIKCDQARISQWENGKYTISKAYQTLLDMYFDKLEKE
jgi:transcriptional regulator with XRE-family HTH domain